LRVLFRDANSEGGPDQLPARRRVAEWLRINFFNPANAIDVTYPIGAKSKRRYNAESPARVLSLVGEDLRAVLPLKSFCRWSRPRIGESSLAALRVAFFLFIVDPINSRGRGRRDAVIRAE